MLPWFNHVSVPVSAPKSSYTTEIRLMNVADEPQRAYKHRPKGIFVQPPKLLFPCRHAGSCQVRHKVKLIALHAYACTHVT